MLIILSLSLSWQSISREDLFVASLALLLGDYSLASFFSHTRMHQTSEQEREKDRDEGKRERERTKQAGNNGPK
jgi:hypothetical protein